MKTKAARKKAPPKKPPGGYTLTELAKAFGETSHTIRHTIAALNPIGKRGKANLYSHAEVAAKLAKRISRTRKSEEVKGSEQRKLDLQCRKLELEIEEKEGKLLRVDDVRSEFAKFCGFVRSHLIKQPSQVTPALEGLSVTRMQKVLTTHNKELLAKLATEPY